MYRPTMDLAVLPVIVLLAAAFGGGCNSTADWSGTAISAYPKSQPMNLKVALVINKEFTDTVVLKQKWFEVTMCRVMGPNAETMAKTLFRDVRIVDSVSATPGECDAIIIPRGGGSVHENKSIGIRYFMFLEWTVSKPTGQLIWQQTIRGQGESFDNRTALRAAVDDAFLKSFTQLSASPEIRKLAANKGVSAAAGP